MPSLQYTSTPKEKCYYILNCIKETLKKKKKIRSSDLSVHLKLPNYIGYDKPQIAEFTMLICHTGSMT